jgi:hypothetical protein
LTGKIALGREGTANYVALSSRAIGRRELIAQSALCISRYPTSLKNSNNIPKLIHFKQQSQTQVDIPAQLNNKGVPNEEVYNISPICSIPRVLSAAA